MWEPTLELQVGLIDNSLDEHIGLAYAAASGDDAEVVEVTVFDGLDLGWHYTSSLDVTITHDLSVTSDEVKGVKKKSSATSLGMSSVGKIRSLGSTAGENDQIYYALSAESDDDRCDRNVDTTRGLQPWILPAAPASDAVELQRQPGEPHFQARRLFPPHGGPRSRAELPGSLHRDDGSPGRRRELGHDPVVGEAGGSHVPVHESWAGDMDGAGGTSALHVRGRGGPPADAGRRSRSRPRRPRSLPRATSPRSVTLAGFNLNFKDAGANRHQLHRDVVPPAAA